MWTFNILLVMTVLLIGKIIELWIDNPIAVKRLISVIVYKKELCMAFEEAKECRKKIPKIEDKVFKYKFNFCSSYLLVSVNNFVFLVNETK